MITIKSLNAISEKEFTMFLGDTFEHSPWIAEKAAANRPFSSIINLHQCMVDIVSNSSNEEKLTLIKKHPNLGDKVEMSDDSTKEQHGAGLKDLTAEEYESFISLNRQYMNKFGFPFILAVRGKDKNDIYQSMKTRIHHSETIEFDKALSEIHKIALFRLQDKIKIEGENSMKNKSAAQTLSYGKGNVFAYRTYSKPLTGIKQIPESTFSGRDHIIFGTNVKVSVGGSSFLTSFTEGDNSMVVATDSMKNFIQRHLATFKGATLEGFASYVSEAFLNKYPQIDTVKLIAEDIPFEAVTEATDLQLKPSDLVFKKSRNERAKAAVEIIRRENGSEIVQQSSSILDLQLIKVSGNSFVGFVRDEYTTLPEDGNRPLFIYLNLHWVYEDQKDAFGVDPSKYVAAEQVIDIATSVFHEMETPSIQNLIYEIGCRILTRFPQLLEVTFESQNHTWDTVVSEIPESKGKVYTEPRPPYGFQVFTVKKENLENNKILAAAEENIG
ncbi:factor-independent urate hydroxylase [Peribacillus sp. NPDC101481]|uniref:factor-independent urate hydroxylase n=1 Tax=Peribacillus sp. NPDC101481 TaxID=3364403 RepID=UPI00380E02DF